MLVTYSTWGSVDLRIDVAEVLVLALGSTVRDGEDSSMREFVKENEKAGSVQVLVSIALATGLKPPLISFHAQ